MIRPTKHSHPDQTVVHVATLLLGELISSRSKSFDSLRDNVKKKVKGGATLFLPALNLLFLLGLVEYRSKTDSFEYMENQ